MRTRWLVLGGLLACALLALAPGGAWATRMTTTVEPGKLTVLSDVTTELPSLPAPADGRIRGYGFMAKVTGDECAGVVSGSGTRLATVAGDEVCAFTLSVAYAPHLAYTDDGQPVPGPAAHVEVGSTGIAVSTTVLDGSSDEELAVAVPKGSDASLVMSAADYAQSFSLTQSERTSTSPVALYRSPGSYEVTSSPTAKVTLSETAVHGGATASVRIGLTSLSLSYFMPGDPLVHAESPSGAYLGLGFSETDLSGPTGVSFANFAALPGSDMRLETPAGEATGQLVETVATGLVANTYAFAVGASTTSGTLTISPGTRDGYETAKSASIETEHMAGGTLVPVRFSDGTLPVGVPDPVPAGGTTTTTTTTTTSLAAPGSSVPGGTHPSTTLRRVTTTTRSRSGQEHEGHGREEGQHHHGEEHHGAPGRVVAAGSPTTVAHRRPVADLVPVVAASAAGGTTVVVIPLLVVLRRRRLGSRLSLRFPPPEPLPPEPPSPPPSPIEQVLEEHASPALVFAEPPAGETADEPVLAVRLLGPPEIDGVETEDAHRAQLLELVTYLAVNAGRNVPAGELRTELGKVDSSWSANTLYTHVARLRKALGRGVLVRSGKSGYRLEGTIRCDWTEFSTLVGRRSLGDDARRGDLTAALALVRGLPFDGVPDNQYRWALSGTLAGEMCRAIEDAAIELVSLELDRPDGRAAAAAALVGLKVAPYSQTLAAALLRAGGLEGRSGIRATWKEIERLGLGGDEELRRLKERLESEVGDA